MCGVCGGEGGGREGVAGVAGKKRTVEERKIRDMMGMVSWDYHSEGKKERRESYLIGRLHGSRW